MYLSILAVVKGMFIEMCAECWAIFIKQIEKIISYNPTL